MTDKNNLIFTRIKKDPTIIGKVDELIDLPKIILVNDFDEDSAKKFYSDFTDAENSDQDTILIVIDSYGGYLYSLLPMVDLIKSSKKKIATLCLGKSMSCGAVLLSCGMDGYRFISPYSTVMIHDVSSLARGKNEEIKADSAEAERLNNLIYKLMDNNCGHPEGYFQKLVHDRSHADWYLTAQAAIEHKMANHIRIPNFEVTIKAEIKLA